MDTAHGLQARPQRRQLCTQRTFEAVSVWSSCSPSSVIDCELRYCTRSPNPKKIGFPLDLFSSFSIPACPHNTNATRAWAGTVKSSRLNAPEFSTPYFALLPANKDGPARRRTAALSPNRCSIPTNALTPVAPGSLVPHYAIYSTFVPDGNCGTPFFLATRNKPVSVYNSNLARVSAISRLRIVS